MTGPTHIVIGVASAMALSADISASLTMSQWFAVCLGALLPDIDSGTSSISRPGSTFSKLLPWLLSAVLNSVGKLISWSARRGANHRGFFHWPVTGLAILLFSLVIENRWGFWLSVGYLSHLVADCCTKRGIPLLAPVRRKPISWSPLRTASFSEGIVATAFSAYILYQLYRSAFSISA